MWTDIDEGFELYLEYAQLITDYRKLSGQPISFEGFHRMTQMALRLEDLRTKLESRQPEALAAPTA